MIRKSLLRSIAESERMMDEGTLPFVWAIGNSGRPERLAVAPIIMKELGLEKGQSINSILQDAIAEMSLKILAEKLQDLKQDIEDGFLEDDFDFRKEMNNDSNS